VFHRSAEALGWLTRRAIASKQEANEAIGIDEAHPRTGIAGIVQPANMMAVDEGDAKKGSSVWATEASAFVPPSSPARPVASMVRDGPADARAGKWDEIVVGVPYPLRKQGKRGIAGAQNWRNLPEF
jgi:hypothetical protein